MKQITYTEGDLIKYGTDDDSDTSPRVLELLTMLTYKRPGDSAGEQAFIARYLTPLNPTPDAFGNLWVEVPRVDGEPSDILWSSHTDTVHFTSGAQKILYGDGVVSLTKGASECLGADCTAGVWLMRQMILARVPGTYIFHSKEESGGQGSRWIAKNTPGKLARFKYAIAFDRKGVDEIITHQFGERSASDAFAQSLGSALGETLGYAASADGIFTDTANYTDLIGECTNISVGYFSMHSPRETVLVYHLEQLLDAILVADFSNLISSRKPGDYEVSDWSKHWYSDYKDTNGTSYNPPTNLIPTRPALEEFVFNHPDLVTQFIEAMGYTLDDLAEFRNEQERKRQMEKGQVKRIAAK